MRRNGIWGWVVLALMFFGALYLWNYFKKSGGFFKGIASPFTASGSLGTPSTPSTRVPGDNTPVPPTGAF